MQPIHCFCLFIADKCVEGTVACNDKKKCILNDYWCEGENGQTDCDDGSDEADGCGELYLHHYIECLIVRYIYYISSLK